ncbi:MAG: response regulator [Candidatus Moranbacteria bacterium]|jgi:DNA-binding response OmpR family regulator|nr:response regulator [Candidatus Moranbacteria bacterium]MDD5652201.1 response regulator [Candidatus Moranbacteria bacterium]MDX9855908.1 response regulator [Candidatus Moranbacteria bacterium]
MKKKILIVEDDVALRQTLAEFLEADSFSVLTAADGEEGVQAAKSGTPDLILLDIVLPKKNGFEAIKEIKKDKKTKDIPIILLTNLGSLSDIEKALSLGATTYLVKGDYQLREIVEKIKDILTLSQK